MDRLSMEDIEFLKELQHELQTQPNDGNADPVFWAVGEVVKDYGIEDGYEDGCETVKDCYGNSITVNYRNRHHVAENTLFITKRECQSHIDKNGYHYTMPHTYAMTALRSPEIERLFNILKTADWEEFAALKKAESEERIIPKEAHQPAFVKYDAIDIFDQWNDTTGVLDKGTSWYYEIQGVIEEVAAMAFGAGVIYQSEASAALAAKEGRE